ncbi:MAG: Cna B-type domain-containing protein, partial [Solobacterium sp.]|nr:Cna B-type domain-containing protein [Solobacterium sp.]
LEPNQDYRTGAVTQGRPLTHKETVDGVTRTVNDGIEAGASVMLVQGYTTSSNKTITEIGNTSNFGNSDTNSGKPNMITLSQKDKAVRYDLYITGPKANMSRVVLIDALPEPGDHSAFVASDKRNSAFTVGLLADNPAFSVALAKKNQSEKKLNADQYTLEISTRTEFAKADWEGNGTGWQPLAEATEEDLKNARSFRIIINDPQARQTDSSKYMMPDETNVHVSFNACINDENAEPGQVAWNSFGYEYTVPQTYMGTEADSIGISLTAQPLNVGLRYPGVPEVTKKLIDENGDTRKAEKDLQFRFLIYRGEPIFDLDRSLNMEEAEIAEVLDSAGRDYIVVPAEIKAGESTVTVRLYEQDWPLAAYAEGWTEKEVPEGKEGFMRWLNGQQYTVLELPVGEYRYSLDGINQGYNNVAFTQDVSESAQLVITNRYEPMHLEIAGRKVWDDEDDYDLLRPKTITVRLLADGEEAASVETDAEQDWAWRFENLTITDETGKIIEYEVKEDEVEGYTTQITEEDPVDTEDGQTRNFTITNK